MTAKFKVGDKVMAKWPKSSLHFNGKVIDMNDIEYLIEFDDDEKSQVPIKYRDVSAPFTPRRSSSRGRSPARTRNKSPSRKSPSRKSPGRPSRKENNVSNSSSDGTAVRSRGAVTPTRQSARLAKKEKLAAKEETKSNDIKTKTETVTTVIKTAKPSGCIFGKISSVVCSLLTGVVPTLKCLPMFLCILFVPFILNQVCTKKKCSLTQLPVLPKDLKFYFDTKAALLLGGFILVQTILALLPVGKAIKPGNGATIRINGYISLLLNLIAIPALLHFKIDILVVYQLYRQLLVASIILGLVLALVFYIKASYAPKASLNPDGNSGHLLPDFLEGREVNPTLGRIDIKFLCFRIVTMSMILLNMVVIMKDIQARNGAYSPTMMIAASLQILYALDFVWFEETYLTTYEYKYQGTGMLVFVGYLSGAFYTLIFSRFVMNHRSELEWYYLVGIAALNLIGYIIMRSSNSQKHAFRTNPSDPALAHLESLPTATGSRLLVSSWWGFVRHPNYLGDILIQITWGLICGFTHSLPWVLVSLTVVFLVTRIFIVENVCKRKYRIAWDSYTSRVKYRLIPRVF